MEKKKKDRSYWIILILLLIIFITSFFLYKNINSGAIGNDNEVIGILTFKTKTIERKYDSDVIWEKIDSGLIIRNKDTIRSGDFSDAVLTLKDKTKININENSMIYLDISEGDINLNFAYGSMSLAKKDDGTSNTTLKIKSGENTVEVKNSELTLEKKDKEELAFQVNQGTAKLKNGTQEKELKENESAKLNKSEIEISEINLTLQSPPDLSIVSEKSDSIPVNFSWSAKNANKLKLELAYDSRFQNLFKAFSVDNDSYTANLPQGNYYWRISSEKSKTKKKSNREYSSFRKVTVYTVSPPIILSPTKNQVFSYSNLPPIIPFTWKRLETARSYNLEISNTQTFTEIKKTFTTNQSSLGVDGLEPGKYFARIITEPAREEFKSETSKVVSFSIERKSELDAPQIISPSNAQEISATILAKSGFNFQAKDSPEISKYIFQISSNSNFSKMLIEETTDSNQLHLTKKLDLGEYFLRVIGITSDGRKSPFSESKKFSVKENQALELLSPANNSTLDLKANPVSFRWKRPSYKASFLLEISASSDFNTKIHTVKTEDFSVSYALPKDGKFFWRVAAIGEDESVLSKSGIFTFQIDKMEELTPVFPVRNERVDMTPLDALKFKWEKHERVSHYLFELYRDKGGSKSLIAKAKTKNSSYTFKDLSKLDEGNFIWTLQESLQNEGETQKGKKISTPFKIYLSAKPGSPAIKTPKKMYVE
jgi:hypothetical protein